MKIKAYILKPVAAVLIATFIFQDIVWANPDIGTPSANTLQVPSIFQSTLGDESFREALLGFQVKCIIQSTDISGFDYRLTPRLIQNMAGIQLDLDFSPPNAKTGKMTGKVRRGEVWVIPCAVRDLINKQNWAHTILVKDDGSFEFEKPSGMTAEPAAQMPEAQTSEVQTPEAQTPDSIEKADTGSLRFSLNDSREHINTAAGKLGYPGMEKGAIAEVNKVLAKRKIFEPEVIRPFAAGVVFLLLSPLTAVKVLSISLMILGPLGIAAAVAVMSIRRIIDRAHRKTKIGAAIERLLAGVTEVEAELNKGSLPPELSENIPLAVIMRHEEAGAGNEEPLMGTLESVSLKNLIEKSKAELNALKSGDNLGLNERQVHELLRRGRASAPSVFENMIRRVTFRAPYNGRELEAYKLFRALEAAETIARESDILASRHKDIGAGSIKEIIEETKVKHRISMENMIRLNELLIKRGSSSYKYPLFSLWIFSITVFFAPVFIFYIFAPYALTYVGIHGADGSFIGMISGVFINWYASHPYAPAVFLTASLAISVINWIFKDFYISPAGLFFNSEKVDLKDGPVTARRGVVNTPTAEMRNFILKGEGYKAVSGFLQTKRAEIERLCELTGNDKEGVDEAKLVDMILSKNNIYRLGKGSNAPPRILVDELFDTDEVNTNFPIYTIALPAFGEPDVIKELIDSISNLIYPKDKLDIILLPESSDSFPRKGEKISTLELLHAKLISDPKKYSNITVLTSPIRVLDEHNQAKPYSTNYLLGITQGKYLVIYDAEDRPYPLQMVEALVGFENRPYYLDRLIKYIFNETGAGKFDIRKIRAQDPDLYRKIIEYRFDAPAIADYVKDYRKLNPQILERQLVFDVSTAYIEYSKLGVLQAPLTWYNPVTLTSTQFILDYGTWFGIFLPGLEAKELPVSHGGTSNHFLVKALMQAGGWDPHNVTEDAAIAIAIQRLGYSSLMLSSVTAEEAPTRQVTSKKWAWIAQHSRWGKGYVQTFLIFLRNVFRHPAEMYMAFGVRGIISNVFLFGVGTYSYIFTSLFVTTTFLWGISNLVVMGPVWAIAAMSFVILTVSVMRGFNLTKTSVLLAGAVALNLLFWGAVNSFAHYYLMMVPAALPVIPWLAGIVHTPAFLVGMVIMFAPVMTHIFYNLAAAWVGTPHRDFVITTTINEMRLRARAIKENDKKEAAALEALADNLEKDPKFYRHLLYRAALLMTFTYRPFSMLKYPEIPELPKSKVLKSGAGMIMVGSGLANINAVGSEWLNLAGLGLVFLGAIILYRKYIWKALVWLFTPSDMFVSPTKTTGYYNDDARKLHEALERLEETMRRLGLDKKPEAPAAPSTPVSRPAQNPESSRVRDTGTSEKVLAKMPGTGAKLLGMILAVVMSIAARSGEASTNYTYYGSGRMHTKSVSPEVDEYGRSYYHFTDESYYGRGYGRVDAEVLGTNDSSGAIGYKYEYSDSTGYNVIVGDGSTKTTNGVTYAFVGFGGSSHASIQAAVDQVFTNGGGVVAVRGGEYNLNGAQIILKDGVRLLGGYAASGVRDISSNTTSIVNGYVDVIGPVTQDTELSGFDIRYDPAFSGKKPRHLVGIDAKGGLGKTFVMHNTLTANVTISFGIEAVGSVSQFVIFNNTISGGSGRFFWAGIHAADGSDGRVEFNRVSTGYGSGVTINGSITPTAAVIQNNMLTNNGSNPASKTHILLFDAFNTFAWDNTFTGSDSAVVYKDADNDKIENNIMSAQTGPAILNIGAPSAYEAGNVTGPDIDPADYPSKGYSGSRVYWDRNSLGYTKSTYSTANTNDLSDPDFNGLINTYEYDGDGRLIKQTNADGSYSLFTDHWVNTSNIKTQKDYDSAGTLLRRIDYGPDSESETNYKSQIDYVTGQIDEWFYKWRGYRKMEWNGTNYHTYTYMDDHLVMESDPVEGVKVYNYTVSGTNWNFLGYTRLYELSPTNNLGTRVIEEYDSSWALIRKYTWDAPFHVGVNLPWFDYGKDIGRSRALVDPPLQKGLGTKRAALDGNMRQLAGIVCRPFVLCDLRSGVKIDGLGNITGFDEQSVSDLRELLNAAQANGVKLILTIFDYSLAEGITGVTYDNGHGIITQPLGEYPKFITDPAKREQLKIAVFDLFNRVQLERYSCVIGFDIMNEPEWSRDGLDLGGKYVYDPNFIGIPQEDLESFFAYFKDALHTNYPGKWVTVGHKDREEFALWSGTNDMYQFHYYDWMASDTNHSPLGNITAAQLGLNGPVFAGELQPTNVTSKLDVLYNGGYTMGLFWRDSDGYQMSTNVLNTIKGYFIGTKEEYDGHGTITNTVHLSGYQIPQVSSNSAPRWNGILGSQLLLIMATFLGGVNKKRGHVRGGASPKIADDPADVDVSSVLSPVEEWNGLVEGLEEVESEIPPDRDGITKKTLKIGGEVLLPPGQMLELYRASLERFNRISRWYKGGREKLNQEQRERVSRVAEVFEKFLAHLDNKNASFVERDFDRITSVAINIADSLRYIDNYPAAVNVLEKTKPFLPVKEGRMTLALYWQSLFMSRYSAVRYPAVMRYDSDLWNFFKAAPDDLVAYPLVNNLQALVSQARRNLDGKDAFWDQIYELALPYIERLPGLQKFTEDPRNDYLRHKIVVMMTDLRQVYGAAEQPARRRRCADIAAAFRSISFGQPVASARPAAEPSVAVTERNVEPVSIPGLTGHIGAAGYGTLGDGEDGVVESADFATEELITRLSGPGRRMETVGLASRTVIYDFMAHEGLGVRRPGDVVTYSYVSGNITEGNRVVIREGCLAVVELKDNESIFTPGLNGCAALIAHGKNSLGKDVYALAHMLPMVISEEGRVIASILKKHFTGPVEIYVNGPRADEGQLMQLLNVVGSELSLAGAKPVFDTDRNMWRTDGKTEDLMVSTSGFKSPGTDKEVLWTLPVKSTAMEIERLLDSIPPASQVRIKGVISDIGSVVVRQDDAMAARKMSELFGVSADLALEFLSARATDRNNPLYIYEHEKADDQALANENVRRQIETWLKAITGNGSLVLKMGDFETIYNSLITGDNPEIIRLITALKEKGYYVRALSNTNDIHYRYLMQNSQLRLVMKPEHIYASHLTGFAKPDSRSYFQVVNDLGLEQGQCLMIDDNFANAAGAIDIGLNAIRCDPNDIMSAIKSVVETLHSSKDSLSIPETVIPERLKIGNLDLPVRSREKPAPDAFKIAGVQISENDFLENTGIMKDAIVGMSGWGVYKPDIVLFPESMDRIDSLHFDPAGRLNAIQSIVDDTGIAAGYFIENDRPENKSLDINMTYAVLRPGVPPLIFRKFKEDEENRVFDVNGKKTALLICIESEGAISGPAHKMPEHSFKDADAILVVAGTDKKEAVAWPRDLSRKYRKPTVFVNFGGDKGLLRPKSSFFFAVEDSVNSKVELSEDSILYADIRQNEPGLAENIPVPVIDHEARARAYELNEEADLAGSAAPKEIKSPAAADNAAIGSIEQIKDIVRGFGFQTCLLNASLVVYILRSIGEKARLYGMFRMAEDQPFHYIAFTDKWGEIDISPYSEEVDDYDRTAETNERYYEEGLANLRQLGVITEIDRMLSDGVFSDWDTSAVAHAANKSTDGVMVADRTYFRNIKDPEQMTNNIIEAAISVLLTHKKLVLAFHKDLFKSGRVQVLLRKLAKLKEDPQFKKLLQGLEIIQSCGDLPVELAKRGIDSADKCNVIFMFAGEDAIEAIGRVNPQVKTVLIDDGKDFESALYYYPLFEIVAITLLKYHQQYNKEDIGAIFAKFGMTQEEFNIKDFKDDDPRASLVFILLPRAERINTAVGPERYGLVLSFIASAA